MGVETGGPETPRDQGKAITIILLMVGLASLMWVAGGISGFFRADWLHYFWFPLRVNPSSHAWQPGILAGHLAHLAGLAGFVVVLLAAGSIPLKWLGHGQTDGLVLLLVRLMLGFGVVATALFGMGLAGLLNAGIFRFVFPALAVWKAVSSARMAAPVVGELKRWPRPVLIVLPVLLLPVMLAPELDTDSLQYHLALPALYLGNGRFYMMPFNCTNWFNQAFELACLPALSWNLNSFGRCMNALWVCCMGLALAATARKFSPGRLAFLAIPLVLSTRGVPDLLASSKNDPAYLAVLAALFAAISAAPRARTYFLAGILGGIGFSIKSISIVYFACICVALAFRAGSFRSSIRYMALSLAGFLLVGGPWVARTLIEVGIPVFPFPGMSRLTPFFPPESFQMFMKNGGISAPSVHGIGALLSGIPATFVKMCPFVTALFLAGLSLDAGLRTARRAPLILSALFIVPWILVLWGRDRYGLPLVLPLGLFAILTAERLLGGSRPIRYILKVLCAVSLIIGLFGLVVGAYRESPVPHFLGIENSSDYVDWRTAPWSEALKKTSGRHGDKTLLIGEIRTFPYTSGGLFDGLEFMGIPVLWKAAHDSHSALEMWKKLRQHRIRWILHNYAWLTFHSDICALYPWTRREIGLYRTLFAGRAWNRWMTGGYSLLKGGYTPPYGAYALYELSDHASGAPKAPYFLPGIEGEFQTLRSLAEGYINSPEMDREIGKLDNSLGHLGILENKKAAIYYARSFSARNARRWSDMAADIWWKSSGEWKMETGAFSAASPSRFISGAGMNSGRFASILFSERAGLSLEMSSAAFMVGVPLFTASVE